MNGIVEVFARWNGMELIENRITFYLYCSIIAPAPPSGLNAPFFYQLDKFISLLRENCELEMKEISTL